MSSAKSLKKLRSASIAFLEDGGTMLHGIDGLVRDAKRLLAEINTREKAVQEREAYVARLESELLGLMASFRLAPAACLPVEPDSPTVADAASKPSLAESPAIHSPISEGESATEAAVQHEIEQLQIEVADELAVAVSLTSPAEHASRTTRPLPSMMSTVGRRRKNRRR